MAFRQVAVAALAVAVLGSIVPPASAGQEPHPKPTYEELPRPQRPRDPKERSFDPHSVLVRFKSGASAAAKDRALKSRGARTAGAVAGTGFVKVRTTGAAADLLPGLRQDPAVQSVSLDYRRRMTAVPNDPAYLSGDQDYLLTVGVTEAWDRTKGSASQVIAVVDTGVNTSHPDLVGRTVAGYNAIAPGSTPTDDNGHGTMVAGIAAANTNNGIGVAGVAWTGRVMPVKVLDSRGAGYDSDVAEGVTWAADHGARVINLSLGGPGDSPALRSAIVYAVAKGAVVVVAAGNYGDNTPMYPAAYPEVLAVGATDTAGDLTEFSSWGDWIDVAAPGFGIVSTGLGEKYYIGHGTSFAAPIASGVAALVRSVYPTLTPAQVMARLRATARDAGPRGIDPYYGYGVLDARYAVGGNWGSEFPQRDMGPDEPNDVPARATVISTSATGTIAMEGDVDWYRYESDGQKSIEVRVTPWADDTNRAQHVDPVLAVYTEDLRLIGETDYAGPEEAEAFALTVGTGRYYIVVRNYNGAPDTLPYTVSIGTAAPTLFRPAQAAAVGSMPETVAVGDVTGDGRADALLATSFYFDEANDYKLFVFPQRGDGSLGTPVRYSTAMAYGDGGGAGLALLDVDGDRRRDVALATNAGVQIFRQTDAGALQSVGLLPATGGAQHVVAADMDGDGDTDLVTTGTSGIVLLAHQPDGALVPSTVTAEGSREVEVGDVDGDGRMDVVAFEATYLRVYHRRSVGWERTEHRTGLTRHTDGIEVADVSGDGRPDVIVAGDGNVPDAKVTVLAQNARGGLDDAVAYPVPDCPEPVEAADLNRDSRVDVVTAHGGWRKLSALLQQSDGTLGAPRTSPIPYATLYNTQGLALGDINGDTRTDAVVADYNHGLVVLYNNEGVSPGGPQAWVRDMSPADFANAASLTTAPTVSFARPVDPAAVNTSTVRLVHGRSGATVAATVAYDAASRTATIRPATALQDNTPYRIVVAGVRDSSGVTQVGRFTTTFRTVDLAPPPVGNLTATGGHGSARPSWTLPAITDLNQVVVRMAAGTTAPSLTSGTRVYAGTGTSATVSGLAGGTTYTFQVWVQDRSWRYSPGRTVRLVGTRAAISSNVTTVTYGGAVTVTGRLVRADTGAAIAGVPVQLLGRRKGTTSWVLLSTRTSSSTGYVAFSHKPAWSLDYLWVYRGSTVFMGAGSALRPVGVRPVVSANLSRTSFALGGSVTLSGGVAPGHAGHRVYLQRLVNGSWVTVTSRLLSTASTYAFAIKPSSRGTYYYRVYKAADTDHLAAVSPTRSFKVY